MLWHWQFIFSLQFLSVYWLSLYGLTLTTGNTNGNIISLFYCHFCFPHYRMRNIDNENCRISFKSYENHQDKLEYIKDNVFYQFIPNSSAWKVIIKNNTDEVVWLNWEKAGFIVNGKASGVSLFPFTTDKVPTESIQSNHGINRTITASNLITPKGINKIYNKRNIRKGGRTSVTIVLPITIGNRPQFFHAFSFTVTKAN